MLKINSSIFRIKPRNGRRMRQIMKKLKLTVSINYYATPKVNNKAMCLFTTNIKESAYTAILIESILSFYYDFLFREFKVRHVLYYHDDALMVCTNCVQINFSFFYKIVLYNAGCIGRVFVNIKLLRIYSYYYLQ